MTNVTGRKGKATPMKNIAWTVALVALASASGCTTGVPADGEAIDGLSDTVAAGCNTVSGLLPTKASLAIAMANELKRWEPLTDLTRATVNGTTQVALSAAGNAQCNAVGNGCPNTKGLLGLQDTAVSTVISQNRFNPTGYREDLLSSLQRQQDRINHLKQNYPAQLPAPHTLTKAGGPTNLGTGACGPHYLYTPKKPDGSAYPTPANLSNALYFFGYPTNGYLSFTVTNGNVGIDPIDGDNAAPITASGTCPTYELDRVYNADNSLLGKCCVTVSAQNGALVAVPRATGYLGCKGAAVPTR